ncbi:MAG: deoxyribonuclease IV [Clostridia bacterium]|nr:deoxyribonuclease IV [Clostridia bacterium]
MLNIGCHLSCSNGYLAMGRQAVEIGANTFQFFTRNPRGGSVKPFDRADAQALNAFMKEHDFAPILAHAPYTLNAAAADAHVREFAFRTMREDLERLAHIPNAMLNFHPGSHVKQGADVGVRLISEMLDEVYTSELPTQVLLETMAGKGSEVGRRFEELRAIMDMSKVGGRLGVCLDTCHVFDGGYDIVNRLDDVLEEFDRVVGLERLKAIHLNDSKNPMASHKDRHEKIGQGAIGLDAMVRIINHPALRSLPFYLETPNELDGYAQEIALLRGACREIPPSAEG